MFTLPSLPYGYDALEPFYSEETLRLHHGKHHQTYTDKLNAAVEAAGVQGQDVEDILKNLDAIPENKRGPVRNHGGGYWNHDFFWHCMSPNPNGEDRKPSGALADAINEAFGSFEAFQEAFNAAAINHFGSGWAWLVVDENGKLAITETHDQVCPLSFGHTPLLTIDVWEHAYYLQFQNRRPEWIDTFWKIVNWEKVAERFES